jgi:signal recognition particle subunit SRP54
MLESLTGTFHTLFRKLSGTDTISERNVAEAMAQVRSSLIEADVHVDVVNALCDQILADAVGRKVTQSLRPGQEMVGIVHRRLIEFLGGTLDEVEANQLIEAGATPALAMKLHSEEHIPRAASSPTIIMMCGLQGSGKTTTCGKLAGYLKKRGRTVMLAAADLQRPAAVEQLETVAGQASTDLPGGATVSFYGEHDKVAAYGKAVGVAVDVCRRALDAAKKAGVDTLILDTAGRLHINDALMGELAEIKAALKPHHTFLVVDAMTGQDAVTSSKAFHSRLSVDGVILTKFDSDTRGGAALSVKQVTGAPIKFVGVGEKLDALEEFHPERFAGRILGMGDVVSLVEKAQQEVSQEEAEALNKKIAKGEMTMDDFLKQLKTLRRMGPMRQLLGLIPGMGGALKDLNVDEKQLDRVEAIINSMTKTERADPDIITPSRRRRIAIGSGVKIEDVSQLVKKFEMVNQVTKTMAGMTAADKVRAVKHMGGEGGSLPPGGLPGLRTKGTSHTPSIKDRFKKRKR